MRVLIPTQVQDVHATVVQRALASRGHDVVLWYGADLPRLETLSYRLEDGRASVLDGPDGRFDVVWQRRLTQPVLPLDLSPADGVFAAREWRLALDGFWNTVAPDAFWVNPRATWGSSSSCKARQLVEAAQVGLRVPPTLVSSDPARIRAFLREHPQAIYKSFAPGSWLHADGSASLLFTTPIGEDDLPDDDALRLTPGLFQPRLDKRFELRVNVIGDRVFGSRLDSQAIASARDDWRAAPADVAVEPWSLPDDLAGRCRALARRLGIVFGCFDFVVPPDGDPVFLEVNTMGQWLWLEQFGPDHRLLDAFCALLGQGRVDYDWDPARAELRFADFYDPARDEATDARHVSHPAPLPGGSGL
ncbi:MAG: hypothetical protein ABMB14_14000 [Myxococcota bacterium]